MTDKNYEGGHDGDSRRSFMKKGAVAASALALGAGATAGTATAQQDQALVFSYDFFPGSDFDVIAQLEQSTTVNVLQTADEETVPEISQPDDWNGHVIRYDMGTETAGVTTFLFTQDGLSAGDTGTLSEDATMFSSQLNLLSSSLNGNGTGTDTDEPAGNETDEPAGNETDTDVPADNETDTDEPADNESA